MTAPPLTPESVALLAVLVAIVAVASYWRSWCAPAAIALSAPFAWYHQIGPTEITISKAVFFGGAMGTAVALLFDASRRNAAAQAVRARPALWLLAAFALFAFASAAWAASPADAIRDALKWTWYWGVMALAAVCIVDRNGSRNLAAAVFLTAAVVGAYGLWQAAVAAPAAFVAQDGSIVGRVVSTLEGPNQFGAYLDSIIPLLMAVLLFSRLHRLATGLGALLLGLLISALLLTYSRGALWSCVAALLFVSVAYFVIVRRPAVRPAVATSASAAAVYLVSALVIVMVARIFISPLGWKHELGLGGGGKADSAAYRMALWSCAWEEFAQHPIAGVGAGNFIDVEPQCASKPAVPDRYNANHWYLETAADLGIVGLALLVGFLCVLIASARSPAVWSDAVLLGAYAVMLAFVLHGFIDDVMTYPKAVLTFALLVGLLPNSRTPS